MAGEQPVGRLPARARVRKKKDFARVRETGRRVRTPHFVLVLSARPHPLEHEPPRLGIVASRRVGDAVRRNRNKRLIREAFRATRDLFEPGLDIVVIVTRSQHAQKLASVVAEWRAAEARIRRCAREVLSAAKSPDEAVHESSA